MSILQQHFTQKLKNLKRNIPIGQSSLKAEGRLERIVGLTLEAVGAEAVVGERCLVVNRFGKHIEAEVVGFAKEVLYLMPVGNIEGLGVGAKVIPTGRVADVIVGDALLGRVINGAAEPLDGLPMIKSSLRVPLNGYRVNPLERDPVKYPLDVGISAINSMLTAGKGQRIGIFSGSGVGKSVTLGMMTKHSKADVVVVGLVGERGREVKEFLDEILGLEGRKKAVIVAAPADSPPLARLHGSMIATAIAEHFRDQGADVLLLIDSLTRFAQAQRELSLAIGEPPATKGYPPSVFAKLPLLVERAGNGDSKKGQGGITAFYTVLMEGDDIQDPIADAARAILDGHILLARELSSAGHYPAIDIMGSISRVMPKITTKDHQKYAQEIRYYYSLYQQNKDLISIGAYAKGSDPEIDRAIELLPVINAFLTQGINEKRDFSQSLDLMAKILAPKSIEPEGS